MSSRSHRGKLLRISSEDKQNGQTNSNFSVNLGNSAFVQSVKAVVVKTVSFKHVFHNIYQSTQTNRNNLFKYSYNSTESSITIPEAYS